MAESSPKNFGFAALSAWGEDRPLFNAYFYVQLPCEACKIVVLTAWMSPPTGISADYRSFAAEVDEVK